jgi:hypothetical protein
MEIQQDVELDIHHSVDKNTIASSDEREGGDENCVEWEYSDIPVGSSLDVVVGSCSDMMDKLVDWYHRMRHR